MFKQAKELRLLAVIAILVVFVGLGVDPAQVSYATATAAEISARITALTGLQSKKSTICDGCSIVKHGRR